MNKEGLGLRGGLVIAIVILLVAITGVLIYYGVTSSEDRDTGDIDKFRKDTTQNSFCGDGSCNTGESSSSCPTDCGSTNNNQRPTSIDIEIESPGDGDIYGYNESIELEFNVEDSAGILDSCWYQIEDEEEADIDDCEEGDNSLDFDVEGNGEYEITVYAKDTSNRIRSDSVDFEVILGAPTINLISPEADGYSNDNPQTFVYTPEDANLDKCELWGNFAGTFKLNQTNNDPENNQQNSFSARLGAGQYLWNIRCVDTENKASATGNRTLTMDFTNSTLTWRDLSYDSGIQKAKAKFTIADTSPTECSADYFGGGNIRGTGTFSSCSGDAEIDIDLPQNGEYEITINGRDAAGNINSIKRNITLNLNCQLIAGSAVWSTDIANIGDNVGMKVGGTVSNACDGLEVEFKTYKENGVQDIFIDSNKVEFVGRDATAQWRVGGQVGGGGSGGFVIPLIMQASLIFGAIFIIGRKGKSKLGSKELLVIVLIIIAAAFYFFGGFDSENPQLQPVGVSQYYFKVNLVSTPNVVLTSPLLSTPGCGNNVIEGTEECDGTDFGQYTGTCYNYNSEIYGKGNLSCSGSCTIGNTSCLAPACGDGFLHEGEQCDDGNANNGDGCSNTCMDEYIRTAADFDRIRQTLGGSFILANDINLQGVNFAPIGSASSPFIGTFNGTGKKISNLNIDANGNSDVGLFGVVSGANIEGLEIEAAIISNGENNIGVLAGRMISGSIKDVHTSGSVSGDDSIGGIMGSMDLGIIEDSSSTAAVNVRISGGGGFIGRMSGGLVIKSFARGAVSSQGERVGGFVGNMRGDSRILNSYSHGGVSANSRAGGFAGQIGENSVIRNSYSKGAVSGGGVNIGGFIGGAAGTDFIVTSCFWDKQTSNQQNSAGGNGVQGKTTSEMKQQSTYPDPPWDFDDTWFIINGQGYPFFQWE